jgi:hypothetical protein
MMVYIHFVVEDVTCLAKKVRKIVQRSLAENIRFEYEKTTGKFCPPVSQDTGGQILK